MFCQWTCFISTWKEVLLSQFLLHKDKNLLENLYRKQTFKDKYFHTSLLRSRCSIFFLSSCSHISDFIASASICKTEGSRFLGSADELHPCKSIQQFCITNTWPLHIQNIIAITTVLQKEEYSIPFYQRISVRLQRNLSNKLLQVQDAPIVSPHTVAVKYVLFANATEVKNYFY